MKIQQNVSLKEYTTFRTGGPASFFCRARSISDIEDACRWGEEHAQPLFVLGSGSNVVVSDEGFKGLVIKNEISGISIEEGKRGAVFIIAGAGENWDSLVDMTVKHNWYGIENLSGIPGTVGASPIQNIGAYGTEVQDCLVWVEVYDTHAQKIKKLSNKECDFRYRDSLFKRDAGKHLVVMRVCLELSVVAALNLSYRDVREFFKEKNKPDITLSDVRSAVLSIRKTKFPDMTRIGTAGSFFKNPIVSGKKATELTKRFPGLPAFEMPGGHFKISLAWLLDHVCGMRGYRDGDVGLFERQPLVVVSYGSGCSSDVYTLSEKIKKEVETRTGIIIEREVTFVA